MDCWWNRAERVSLLLSGAIVVAIAALLFVNISAELTPAHEHHENEVVPTLSAPAKLQSQGLEMQLSGDTSATVGKPAQLQVRVWDAKTQQPLTDVALRVKTRQLENKWVAFAYEGTPDSAGKLAWQQEFFDGTPHSIEVEAIPLPNASRRFQPFQVAQDISVEGVAPPLYIRLISLSYFTGIVGVGLLLGLKLRQRRMQQLYLAWKRNFS